MPSKDCLYDAQEKLRKSGIKVSIEDMRAVALDLENKFKDLKAISKSARKNIIDAIKAANSEAITFNTRNKMMKLRAKTAFFDRANKLKKANPDKAITYHDVLEAELVGSNVNLKGYRNSVDARSDAMRAEYIGNLLYELDEAGLTKIFSSNKYDSLKVAKELYAMNKEYTLGAIKQESNTRKAGKKYNVTDDFGAKNVSGDEQAFGIAKIIAKIQYNLVIRANRAGAYIKIRPDYVFKQAHNADIIHKAGIDKWKAYIKPLLDEEETFGTKTPKEREDLLNAVFYDIVYGKPSPIGSTKIKTGQAARLSRGRVINFKDADMFMEYNNKFGSKDLSNSVLGTIGNMSRDISLMEKFGPNADRSFEELIADFKVIEYDKFKIELDKIDKTQKTDLEKQIERAKFEKKINRNIERKERKLRHQYSEVSGATAIPVLGVGRNVGRIVRSLHNMSKLGTSAISAFADAGFFPFEASYQGMAFPKAFIKGITAPLLNPMRLLLRGKTRAEQVQIARQLGVGMDYFIASALDKFSVSDAWSGKLSKPSEVGMLGAAGDVTSMLQRKYFKLNGLTWITDTFKEAFTMMASNNLAVKRDMDFDNLGSRLRNVLGKYNIDAKKWDLIKTTAFKSEHDGRWFITPDKIRYLSDATIEKYVGATGLEPNRINQIKTDIETDLRSYFVDRADYASPTPGAKEMAMMYKSARPGSVHGEMARFFWQFKSFAVTVLNKAWGREINGRYNKTSAAGRMAAMLLLTTATGIVAYSAKQATKGQVPTVFTKPIDEWDAEQILKVFGTGFMQGGGAGIYGDLLMGTKTRYGGTALETVGGPTASLFNDLMKMPGFALSDIEKEIYGDRVSWGSRSTQTALKTIKRMTPGINLPFMKPLVDNYLWYSYNEMLNPGYMRRVKRQQRKDDKEFWIDPKAGTPFDMVDDVKGLFE